MAYEAEHIRSRQVTKMHDFDPGATTVTVIEWRPIKEYRRFLAGFFRTIGTGAVTFDIAAATDASGTGVTQVVAHAVGDEPNALEDQIYLECDAAQIQDALSGATHWTARVSVATATDEGVVLTEEHEALFPRTGLTADIVA